MKSDCYTKAIIWGLGSGHGVTKKRKYVLVCRDYVRYSDDFCLFGNDKKQLGEFAEAIQFFVASGGGF